MKLKKKTLRSALALMMCAVSLLPASAGSLYSSAETYPASAEIDTYEAEASAEVVYDLNTLPVFSGRTKESVASKYKAALSAGKTYKDGTSSTYYQSGKAASTKSPYCEGTLTDDTIIAMQSMTDFYRWLVGVPALKKYYMQDQSLQYQALDRNFEFNHFISDSSKPSDMSTELWNKGKECDHNILAGGYTPQGAITGWMNEGYSLRSNSWDTFGHRYAMIEEGLSGISYGYCGNIAIGRDEEYNNTGIIDTAYAFPAPGYTPDVCVNPKECGWNLDFDTSKLSMSSASSMTVTVKDLTANTSYTCTTSNNKLKTGTNTLCFVQPSVSTTRYKNSYKVTATGFTDKATGKSAAIEYTVNFFDPSNYSAQTIDLTVKVSLATEKGEAASYNDLSVDFYTDAGVKVGTYKSDSTGKVTAKGIEPGVYRFIITKPGYATRAFRGTFNATGTFQTVLCKYGDLDGDGDRDNDDVILLQQKVCKWNVSVVYPQVMDCDGSGGDPSNDDVIRLQQFVCKWRVKLGEP